MKRKAIITSLILILVLTFAACGNDSVTQKSEDTSGKLMVIATLFPQYDFARIVGGDKVDVQKLLPNGAESHSYEPTTGDIININKADVFIYTGSNMEPWSATIIDGADSKDITIVDLSKNMPLVDTAVKDHAHEDYAADPHIWTDPTRAMIMVDNIATSFAKKDKENAAYYKANAEAYKEELTTLDNEIKTIVAEGKRDKIIFGGRFAFFYFCEHYGLKYDAAYDSCSEAGEPSAKKVAELIDEIKSEKIPVIYYEEMRKPTVAKSIADDTGAEMLLLHSCHNVTDAELADGVTYLSLMEQNAANLKKGMN